MPTNREVQAKKTERIRAEDRRKALRGPDCPVCHLPTWKPLVDETGDTVHATCSDPDLMAADRLRLATSVG